MKQHILKPIVVFLGTSLFAWFTPLNAQWIGAGTTGGTGGTDLNAAGNWTGGTINGAFTSNTATTTLSLSDNLTLSSGFNFAWATSGLELTINGNGSGVNEVIALNGDITVRRASSGTAKTTFGSDVTLDFGTFSSNRGIAVSGTGTTYGSVVINGVVTGTATGTAALEFGKGAFPVSVSLLNDSNSFTAPIITGGTLSFTSVSDVGGGTSALGSATTVENGTITLTRNAILNYVGSTDQSTDRRIVLSGTLGPIGISHSGTAGTLTYTSEIAGDIYPNVLNLKAGSTTAGASTAVLEIAGVISNGEAGLTRVDTNVTGEYGTVRLSNTGNTYKGATLLSGGGVLEVMKLADGGEVSSVGMSSSQAANLMWGTWGDRTTTLRYIGAGDSTNRLFTVQRLARIESSGTGAVNFTNTGAIGLGTGTTYGRVLALGGTNTGDNTLAVAIGDYAAAVTANATRTTAVTKNNSGKWILTGANTYTGATTINEGTLLVHGTLTSAVTVNAGTFGGNGSSTGNLTIGNNTGVRDAIFSSGAGIGSFATTGGLDIKSDGEFAFTFNSTTGTGGFVTASGVTIASAAFFNFLDVGNGSGVSLNQSFVVLNNSGISSITGTFANLTHESTFVSNGVTWQASYAGGVGGNDLVLTAVALSTIPEPSSYALIMGALGLLGVGLRRFPRNVS